jgi:hypothetical protein
MNFRVILLVLLVFIFTIGCILISNLSFQSTSLKDSYNDGNVDIIQNTSAGTVPHMILIKNKGKKPLMVESGQLLVSNSSQDVVVAEDKWVNQNSSSFIRVYCYQPNQTANPGTKLIPADKAPTEIRQIIKSSNLTENQNMTQTQIQIWLLVSKNDVNTNSGEAIAFTDKQGINSTDLTQKVQSARTGIIQSLNISETDIKNFNTNSSTSFNDIFRWISAFVSWIENAFSNN